MQLNQYDTQVLRDIEEIYQMVELEASLAPREFIPKGAKHKAKWDEQEARIVKLKAELYRDWLRKKGPGYATKHQYLFIQFLKIQTLPDAAVVAVMTKIRKGLLDISLAERAEYARIAKEEQAERWALKVSKKQFRLTH
jgi:hypothetical protein